MFISEFVLIFSFSNLNSWIFLASSTLFLITSLFSIFLLVYISEYSTFDIFNCISILSTIGPLSFDKYLFILVSEQVQFFSLLPRKPHGQGFIAAIKTNLHGYCTDACTLSNFIACKSNIVLNISNFLLSNSANSSINNIPKLANVIAPGIGFLPPPTNDAKVILGFTSIKGLLFIISFSLIRPSILLVFVISIISS